MNINQKTTVPLFAILGAVVVLFSSFASSLLWVSSISSKAEAAITKNNDQDQRMDRQKDFLLKQQDLLIEIRDRGIRTEESVKILLKQTK